MESAENGENPVVQTTSGKLKGIYEDGLYVFKGVPYAAPPISEFRWLPPQLVQAWSGRFYQPQRFVVRWQDPRPGMVPREATL